ncbi:hypothetical protein BY996DRAFT_6420146 [Phakopsora pachyrhizi]|nr:hypothetical protein BY996DRAFT_6420146 [Phakopsora pachyrhizi]
MIYKTFLTLDVETADRAEVCGELHEIGVPISTVTFRSILGACVDVTDKKIVPTKSFIKIDKQVTGYFFQEKHLKVSTTYRGVKSDYKCKKESNIGMIMKCDRDKSKLLY